MKEHRYKGIVILDVDGVLFKDIFLKRIVQSKGILSYIKILWLGIQYYINKISINRLLVEGYKLAENFHVESAQVAANKIRRVTNIKESISILRQEGFFVSLISAGIPNFVLKNLAHEIGADHYAGIDLEINKGIINTRKIRVISKIEIVETLLKRLDQGWNDVISVADDPNNVELLKKSRMGIGFNPSKIIRKFSDIIIESNNFLEILPYIIPQDRLPKKYTLSRFSWKREFFRKGIHFLGCFFPFLALSHELIAIHILTAVIVIYIISELFRNLGISFILFSYVTKKAQRHRETKGIIVAPILLGLGIMLTILLFDFNIYLPAILIVSVADCLSALIGMRFGKIHLFHLKNRTLIGSLTFFLSSFIILFFTIPFRFVLPAALLGIVLELIPVYHIDNLLIPLGTGMFLYFAFATGT
jgi:dolichol kinase/phosphoserine phosphatase